MTRAFAVHPIAAEHRRASDLTRLSEARAGLPLSDTENDIVAHNAQVQSERPGSSLDQAVPALPVTALRLTQLWKKYGQGALLVFDDTSGLGPTLLTCGQQAVAAHASTKEDAEWLRTQTPALTIHDAESTPTPSYDAVLLRLRGWNATTRQQLESARAWLKPEGLFVVDVPRFLNRLWADALTDAGWATQQRWSALSYGWLPGPHPWHGPGDLWLVKPSVTALTITPDDTPSGALEVDGLSRQHLERLGHRDAFFETLETLLGPTAQRTWHTISALHMLHWSNREGQCISGRLEYKEGFGRFFLAPYDARLEQALGQALGVFAEPESYRLRTRPHLRAPWTRVGTTPS